MIDDISSARLQFDLAYQRRAGLEIMFPIGTYEEYRYWYVDSARTVGKNRAYSISTANGAIKALIVWWTAKENKGLVDLFLFETNQAEIKQCIPVDRQMIRWM